ncbi:MAG: phosphoribosylformylglycinamidine synthase subunit PurL [Bacteroidia bacterium]
MEEQLTTVETAKDLGLLPEEFDKICEILGRVPNFNELSVYSVMWSEHCSYKNSIVWLKTLPKEGERMLAKAGEENAGLVDIGDGLGCAFKIESHNHPSAIEPYQGAATGVGGINRDIFTMGARPIAQLNSLRFGNLQQERTKWIIRGVVKGIGDYGNAFGVPTVGGEVYFDDCFTVNPLVNAMSVGIVEKGKTVSAISYGVGNPVFIVGSHTGKDGIHGAAFASKDITEDSADDLPSVQVGDPFQEKLLLEATLEAIDTGAIVGMQDMGAAGIICSSSEMSAKGEHGMVIWLDRVPTRQENMKPWEILLSESQERMLIVCKKGQEDKLLAVFDKWDINCEQIGEVTEGERLKFYMHNELVADVPAESLVLGGGAPVYHREYKEPAYLQEIAKYKNEAVPLPADLMPVMEQLATHPNLCSKKWVYQQYDSMVGTINMSTNQPSDAAVVDVRGTNKALAMSVDCNSRYIYADPHKGTAIAVAEAARNIVCSGGEAVAVTNCLNFGNPYNPEVYWQFVGAIKGMGEACLALGTPVTGGNVSFYNQSSYEGPVYPSPVIGMVGILDDKRQHQTLYFKRPGDLIYVLGEMNNDLGSSQYIYSHHNIKHSSCPHFELEAELLLHKVLHQLRDRNLAESMHDIADGGLFINLIESGFYHGLGFNINTDPALRTDAFLFGESQSRAVISIDPHEQPVLEKVLYEAGIPFRKLGSVTEGDIQIDGKAYANIAHFSDLYDQALGKIMEA